MSSITEEDAFKFAELMAKEYPPSKIYLLLIRGHIDWWEENYPEYAPVVRDWYMEWYETEDRALAEGDGPPESKARSEFVNEIRPLL